MPLNIVLASAIQQHESAIGIRMSPSLLILAPTSHQSLLIYSVIQYFAISQNFIAFFNSPFFIFTKSTYSYFTLYFSCRRPYFSGFFKVQASVIFLFHISLISVFISFYPASFVLLFFVTLHAKQVYFLI